MSFFLSIKTLVRTPLKTLVTFLLLAATSYMLFFNAAEYAVTSREFKRTKASYMGIGAVETRAFKPLPIRSSSPNNKPSISGADAFLYADSRVAKNPYDYDSAVEDSYIYAGIKQSDAEAIENLPYVTAASTRYMTAGVSPDFLRSDLMNRALMYPKYNYTARFIAEVTVVRHIFKTAFGYYTRALEYDVPSPPLSEREWRSCGIVIDDVKILAGDRSCFDGYTADLETGRFGPITLDKISLFHESKDSSIFGYYDVSVRERFSSVMHYGTRYYDEVYSYDFLDELVPGEKYIIIGRMEPVAMKKGTLQGPVLADPATIEWWPQVYPLKGLPDNYMELDEFAPLREMIEITNTDLSTFDVVYTDGMSLIRRFADGSMFVADGRMLSAKDSDENKNVCVMSRYFMQNNSLNVGDTIRLRLGDKLFEQNSAVGAVASVRERFADSFTDEIEFEIVGAFADTDVVAEREQSKNLPWTYSDNTIFVPLSFLPCEVPEDHAVKPGEYSFVVGDASDISSFLTEQAPFIEDELGLTLIFSDSGWLKVEEQIGRDNTLVVIKLALFSMSALIAVGLTVYLFVMRKRKEYAIMRALGTPVRKSNRSLYIPLWIVAASALAAGYALAYINAGNAIAGSLEAYARIGIETSAEIPASVTALCITSEIAALALITAFAFRRIGAKPPLELLQAGAKQGSADTKRSSADATQSATRTKRGYADADRARGARSPQHTKSELSITRSPTDSVFTSPAAPLITNNASRSRAIGFVMQYITQHIRRSAVKSMLSAGVALLLLGTIGQLTLIRGVHRDAYENIGVNAYIVKGLKLKQAIEIAESDYVRKPANKGGSTYLKDPYFENIISVLECNAIAVEAVMTNDIERFCDAAVEIEFLDGYGRASMGEINSADGNICVLEDSFMEEHGIKLGDSVGFTMQNLRNRLQRQVLTRGGDDELLKIQGEFIDRLVEESTAYYTVVGRLHADGERSAQSSAFIPVGNVLDATQNWISSPDYSPSPDDYIVRRNTWGNAMIFQYAEYTLVSRDNVEEFRSYAKRLIVESVGSNRMPPLTIDPSEADGMTRTMELLDGLYPIAVAAAAVLGALFPGLVVMQSDREASIMRVLGTTKKRARAMLVTEQAALFFGGLICAVALLLIINGALLVNYTAALLSYTTLHLIVCVAGALVCSVIITRRSPLELLQVKE